MEHRFVPEMAPKRPKKRKTVEKVLKTVRAELLGEFLGTFLLCFVVWETAVSPVASCGKRLGALDHDIYYTYLL